MPSLQVRAANAPSAPIRRRPAVPRVSGAAATPVCSASLYPYRRVTARCVARRGQALDGGTGVLLGAAANPERASASTRVRWASGIRLVAAVGTDVTSPSDRWAFSSRYRPVVPGPAMPARRIRPLLPTWSRTRPARPGCRSSWSRCPVRCCSSTRYSSGQPGRRSSTATRLSHSSRGGSRQVHRQQPDRGEAVSGCTANAIRSASAHGPAARTPPFPGSTTHPTLEAAPIMGQGRRCEFRRSGSGVRNRDAGPGAVR